MSWEDVLGNVGAVRDSNTEDAAALQNAQNPQNLECRPGSRGSGGFEDIVRWLPDFVVAVETAVRDQPISVRELTQALGPSDIEHWVNGAINVENLRAFATHLVDVEMMREGKAPPRYIHSAQCERCGPIWHYRPGFHKSCPWCHI